MIVDYGDCVNDHTSSSFLGNHRDLVIDQFLLNHIVNPGMTHKEKLYKFDQ